MLDSPTLPTALPAIAPNVREQVVTYLTESFAHDRLSLVEFERRVAAAFSAATPGELTALTADLTTQTAGTDYQLAHVPRRIDVILGSVERAGFTIVPERLAVRSILGTVELDMSGAQFAPGVTEIELRATLGNIEIRLPAHVQVEIETKSVLASVESQGMPASAFVQPTDAPVSVVRFTGRAVLGSVSIDISPAQIPTPAMLRGM